MLLSAELRENANYFYFNNKVYSHPPPDAKIPGVCGDLEAKSSYFNFWYKLFLPCQRFDRGCMTREACEWFISEHFFIEIQSKNCNKYCGVQRKT
jgi:hypothetical protein